jgi:glycosyltransferase involved in cell wall biosynthesis
VKVSIIISVLNGAKTLQSCLDSIALQDYNDIELVVVDGGSSDGTIQILGKNEDIITSWLSEPDSGIYDAWNKGLEIVTGEYICFIGCDDCFAERSSISEIISLNDPDCCSDIITSEICLVDDTGKFLRVRGNCWKWSRMMKHCSVVHPGLMHHKNMFERHGKFDTRYKIAGDYDFLLRLGPETSSKHLNKVTVLMGMYGVSNINILEVLEETRMIHSSHPSIGKAFALYNYYISRLKVFVKLVLAKFSLKHN